VAACFPTVQNRREIEEKSNTSRGDFVLESPQFAPSQQDNLIPQPRIGSPFAPVRRADSTGKGGGCAMEFYEVLDWIVDLLRSRGRVSYRALKRQFILDDAYL
jgi:hypothetical protein